MIDAIHLNALFGEDSVNLRWTVRTFGALFL